MTLLRVLADENIPAARETFAPVGQVSLASGRDISPADVARADVLLVRSVTRVNEDLLAGSALQFVGSATSGLDHVDRPLLAERGIAFAHAPGANANSVVEYVLAAIARVDTHLEALLQGEPVGVVGYGHIGRCLAARLSALGIAYRVYDPWLEPAEVSHPASLQQVLSSRVVSLHCELTDRRPWPSRHLLGARELGQLAPGSLLINASRGEVVDGRALLALLTDTGGASAVLDVWEGEPHIDPSLLQRVRLGTPHIAGYSHDGKLAATRMLYRALCSQIKREAGGDAQPGDDPAPLDLPQGLTGATLLRHLLALRYDIEADDAALRSAARNKGAQQLGPAFDGLRRQYPRRRELLGAAVDVRGLADRDVRLVQGLGCRVVGAGERLP